MIRAIKTFGFLLLLVTGQVTFGQTTFHYKRDFKKVLAKTKDQDNSLSYDKLLKRFTANDTTLTDFEVLALLIGFTYNPEYKPYEDLVTESEIHDLTVNGKYQEALDSVHLFIKTHPLSVKALFETAYSFYKLGQGDSATFYSYKARRIFKAMKFSGDGRSHEAPIFALGPADGQDYIYKFLGSKIGTMGSGTDDNGNFLDVLGVIPKNNAASYNLYFIIQHATDKMFSEDELKMFDDKDKKKKKHN